jgi:TIR domain
MPSVFISYVRQDEPTVVRLAHHLKAFGINVWTDKSKIQPGMRWKDAIRRGILEGDFFVACFSDSYLGRDRSYMNEEIILAIEELRQKPANRAWFIPVLLSSCEVLDRIIGPGETLRSIQWVELYVDWSKGVSQILSVIYPQMGVKSELLEQLKSESARARINAADQIGAMGEFARDMAPNLLELLPDENWTPPSTF